MIICLLNKYVQFDVRMQSWFEFQISTVFKLYKIVWLPNVPIFEWHLNTGPKPDKMAPQPDKMVWYSDAISEYCTRIETLSTISYSHQQNYLLNFQQIKFIFSPIYRPTKHSLSPRKAPAVTPFYIFLMDWKWCHFGVSLLDQILPKKQLYNTDYFSPLFKLWSG